MMDHMGQWVKCFSSVCFFSRLWKKTSRVKHMSLELNDRCDVVIC